MKKIMCVALGSMLALAAAPAYASGMEVWQVFDCKMEEETTEEEILAAAKKWLQAARTMKGGEQLRASVHFPVAAASGDTDFNFVIKAPSFAAWGTFWDGYKGSPAHKVDQESDEITQCPNSRLFEGTVVEPDVN